MIILFSILLIIIGLLYFYFPNAIIKFFEFVNKHIFNERVVVLYGKKIGLIFILFGLLIFAVNIRYKFSKNKLYSAYKSFYSRNFVSAQKVCLDLLVEQPKNVDALELLGKIYLAQEKYNLAKNIFLKAKSLTTQNRQKIIDRYIELIDYKIDSMEKSMKRTEN